MYSERLPHQVTSGGHVINPINHNNNKKTGKTDEDFFRATIDERTRILNFVSKPCPPDFPKELKHLWKNNLEFSLTPCQSGWMQLMEKTHKPHNSRRYYKKRY
tara:strand:+ start:329 stop:637 length:309 start_codon:yes stop_codon:yes gene_type:complete